MARVLVISDTHIPKVGDSLPREVLEAAREADLVLHAGDLVDMRVLEELRALAPVRAVAGNMDLPEVSSVLPQQVTVEVEGKLIGLIHGWGPPVGIERRVLSRFSGVDAVVFGHTHRACVDERKGVLLVNPGTPTDRRFSDRLSYALLTIENGVIDPSIIWLG